MNSIQIHKRTLTVRKKVTELIYYILINEINDDNVFYKEYGVRIDSNEDSASAKGITASREKINSLIDLLADNCVTPTHLQDVLEDLAIDLRL